jgi:ABC-type uncharacterized transport system YnjBCD ATPase subunit
VLLLDEPFSSLDAQLPAEVRSEVIQAIGWEGVAEHMPPEALADLRGAFDDACINPAEVVFPEWGEGVP